MISRINNIRAQHGGVDSMLSLYNIIPGATHLYVNTSEERHDKSDPKR